MQRRIYEVVEDVNHGLRQCTHVKKGYYPEIDALALALVTITDRLSQSRTGLVTLTDTELRKLNSDWTFTTGRLGDVTHIFQDRVAREASLAIFTRIAAAQLFARHSSLTNFTEGFKKTPRGNVAARKLYLDQLATELGMYAAPDVRSLCNRACYLIIQAANQLNEPQHAIAKLMVATKEIAKAASKLAQSANTMEEKGD
jgi:hypothetical protein